MDKLWLDVETTGLYADKHDITQLACIPVINGVPQEPFNEHCQPLNWNSIQQEALNVTGMTVEKLKTFQTPAAMIDKFIKYLAQFNTRFTIAGHNVNFDKGFVSHFFSKNGRSQDFFKYFTLDIHCTLKRAKEVKKSIGAQNLKLGTLAAHWGIEINAHDALSDISATVEIDKKLATLLGEEEVFIKEHADVADIVFDEPAQLHVHSSYGYNSVNGVREWASWCEDNGVPGFGIVDHGLAVSFNDISSLTLDKKTNTRKPVTSKGVVGVPGVGLYVEHGKNPPIALNAWATSTQDILI